LPGTAFATQLVQSPAKHFSQSVQTELNWLQSLVMLV